MRWFWKKINIPGNPFALARLVVICFCLLAAGGCAYKAPTSLSVIVGSFLGAALSLTVNWAVSQLEKPDVETTPVSFILAAKADIASSGYYREDQHIGVAVLHDKKSNSDLLEITFTANIVPTIPQARVYRPVIQPPSGVTLIDAEYWVGNGKVYDLMRVDKKTSDRLVVRYHINDSEIKDIEDDHLWPCPVMNYSVSFLTSDRFSLNVMKLVGRSGTEALQQEKLAKSKQFRFFGSGAAFTSQGLRWHLERKRALPKET